MVVAEYIHLAEAESVFRALKTDLRICPIWHYTSVRVEAHIMVAFLGYALWICLKHKLKAVASSLSPWQLLDQLQRIQMVEVWVKLKNGGASAWKESLNRSSPKQKIRGQPEAVFDLYSA